MTKKNLPTIKKPEKLINIRKSVTIEEALGIDKHRFEQLGKIMNKICKNHPTKAEGLMALANHPELTDLEKTYMGFKLYDITLLDSVTTGLMGMFK